MKPSDLEWKSHPTGDPDVQQMQLKATKMGWPRTSSAECAEVKSPEGREVKIISIERDNTWFLCAVCGVHSSPVLGPTPVRDVAAMRAAVMATEEPDGWERAEIV